MKQPPEAGHDYECDDEIAQVFGIDWDHRNILPLINDAENARSL
jgi:hypothetical protein